MKGKLIFVAIFVLPLAWQVQAVVNCNQTGAGRFADPDDMKCKNYTLCVATGSSYIGYEYSCPSTSLFNPMLSLCTTDYTCNKVPNPSTSSPISEVCIAEGYFANIKYSDCLTYVECVNINGWFIQTTYSCAPNTYFNPNTGLCDFNYVCPLTSSFTCSQAGRFADSQDSTCKRYFFCVKQLNGMYVKYSYTCPSISVFNPSSKMCTTSYTCVI